MKCKNCLLLMGQLQQLHSRLHNENVHKIVREAKISSLAIALTLKEQEITELKEKLAEKKEVKDEHIPSDKGL